MAVIETWFKQDLKSMVAVHPLPGNVFTADNDGNLIGIEVFDDGAPADIAGTVSANVIRPDGGTVSVGGTLADGNRCYVILPQAAYAYPGPVAVIIKLTNGTTVTTIGAVVGDCKRSTTDAVVDPGTIIPSVQTLIDEIEAAIADVPASATNLRAAMAETYSTSGKYAVGSYAWQEGVLYKCTTAITTGESWTPGHWTAAKLANDVSDLKSAFDVVSSGQNKLLILSRELDFETGSISTSTGNNGTTSGYIRTKAYYPAIPLSYVMCDEHTASSDNMRIFFYDRKKNYIGYKIINNPESYSFSTGITFSHKNAAFFRLAFLSAQNSNTVFHVRFVGDGLAETIDYEYKRNKLSYIVIKNAVLKTNFGLGSEEGYDTVIIPYPETSKIFINYTAVGSYALNACALYEDYPSDSTDAEFLTAIDEKAVALDTSTLYTVARSYDIPSNAVAVVFTMPVNAYQAFENPSCYANLFRNDNRPFSGKKILCIGDSITGRDGRASSTGDETGRICGYQKKLRNAGAYVASRGYSGLPLAKSENHESIYERIVEEELDVSDFDIVILFAGTNDIIYKIPVGDFPTSYKQTEFDPWTLSGAYSAILRYIRINNPTCKVFTVTMDKSQDGLRIWDYMLPYRDALMRLATFWTSPIIDLFTVMNVSPWATDEDDPDGQTITQFRYFHYDGTHPNYRGMMRIGDILVSAIANENTASWTQGKNPLDGLTVTEGENWEE